jgi:hypothetical protein
MLSKIGWNPDIHSDPQFLENLAYDVSGDFLSFYKEHIWLYEWLLASFTIPLQQNSSGQHKYKKSKYGHVQ